MDYKALFIMEKEIANKFEDAIDALLAGNNNSYLMLREAKTYAQQRRKEAQNGTGIQDSDRLEVS